MDPSYNLAAIRHLLLGAFGPETLRRFCQDRPALRPIIDTFGPGHGLDDMVGRVIDYCLHHDLFSELLPAIEQDFPRQYARFGPYSEPAGPRPLSPTPEQLACWDEKLKAYKKRMAERYGTTQIFGQPRPVPLDQVFTDVYILEKPVAFRRFDIQQLRQDPDLIHDAKRVPGRIMVARPDAYRLFILGRPGVGKTTFLKLLVLETTRGNLDKVPVFVTLKEWADTGQDILPFIVQQFAIFDFPDAGPFVEHLLCETDTALVLFDGLDEVSRENRAHARAIAAVKGFAERYRRAQCLVTCRTASTDHTFEGFTYVEVAGFTREQIEALVRNWFHAEPDKVETFLTEINREQNRGLRELARTPLLLAMLCLAFNETLCFPARRVEIYQDALDALLRKWDSSRSIQRDEVYRALSPRRKQQIFACIAAQSFEQAEYFIPQDKLKARVEDYLAKLPKPELAGEVEIDGQQVLRSIEAQHGILVERAHRIYSFAHLSFQEYYAARYSASDATQETLHQLLSHCGESRWQEVILLVASLLENADRFLAIFRRAIDDLVAADDELVAFLRWAMEESNHAQVNYRHVALRSGYCFLALQLSLTLDLAQAYLLGATTRKPDTICAQNSALDHARQIDQVLRVNRAISQRLDIGRATEIYNQNFLGHAFGFVREGESAQPTQPERKRFYTGVLLGILEYELGAGEALGADRVQRVLAEMVATRSTRLETVVYMMVNNLRAIAREQWSSGNDRKFSAVQLAKLADYFSANHLLLQCLDLAYASNRRAIEDSLLLPPGMWQPEDFTR